jgi:hypothetical protein
MILLEYIRPRNELIEAMEKFSKNKAELEVKWVLNVDPGGFGLGIETRTNVT